MPLTKGLGQGLDLGGAHAAVGRERIVARPGQRPAASRGASGKVGGARGTMGGDWWRGGVGRGLGSHISLVAQPQEFSWFLCSFGTGTDYSLKNPFFSDMITYPEF